MGFLVCISLCTSVSISLGLKIRCRVTELKAKHSLNTDCAGGLVTQSWPTLYDPMDCSLQGFSVHGIFQASILEWIAISFSKGSSWPRDRTWVSCPAGRFFTNWATREYCPLKSVPTHAPFLPTFTHVGNNQDQDFCQFDGEGKNHCFNFHFLDNNQLALISMIVDPFTPLSASSNSLNIFWLGCLFFSY